MSIHRRIVLPDHPHHVILRGNNRRRLFSYASDYGFFCLCIVRGLARFDVKLHAIALMTNHVHLVATPGDAVALAKWVQRISQRYAQVRNLRRDGSGKLFEQRYQAFPILSEKQLAITTAYVDLNPVRAGLVVDPEKYPWSSAAIHAGAIEHTRIPLSIWSPSSWYAQLAASTGERAVLYSQWIARVRERDETPERVRRIEVVERLSQTKYTRRLERPNRRRAV